MLTATREREGLGRVVGSAISPAAALQATSRPTGRLPMPLGRPAQPQLSVPPPPLRFRRRELMPVPPPPCPAGSVFRPHHISSSGPSLYLAPLRLAISIPEREREVSVLTPWPGADETLLPRHQVG